MVEYDIKAVIIFPCFNEEDRINKVMLLEFIQNNLYSYIFVNDGSTDGTLEILNELKKESSRINVIDLDQNTGKANAIQQGMMFAIKQLDSELYGFWDVDLSTPLPEIEHLLEEYSRTKAMILTGCRVKRLGAKIERSGVRHFLGRSFATIFPSFLIYQLMIHNVEQSYFIIALLTIFSEMALNLIGYLMLNYFYA